MKKRTITKEKVTQTKEKVKSNNEDWKILLFCVHEGFTTQFNNFNKKLNKEKAMTIKKGYFLITANDDVIDFCIKNNPNGCTIISTDVTSEQIIKQKIY